MTTGPPPRRSLRRRLRRGWPLLVYAAGLCMGSVGLAADSSTLLAFSGEVLLIPGLIQAQQARNRRRRRGEDDE